MRNIVTLTPPMGWNSWDCYGASVTEEEVRGNALYMADNLKDYGWEYIIVDIQWYEPNATTSLYNPFVPLEMDEYSRLNPAVNRFPSSAYGKGFKPLADYVHSLGLKFGIHIMRGIPRQAAHSNTPILGTNIGARDISHPFSLCPWNTDMYGVDSSKEGAQQYYDSLVQLYSSWGVDYVKVDDIAYSFLLNGFSDEIELIRNAIDRCGREIVLSLSPGPALVEHAELFMKNANMWRITADYWDRWEDLLAQFEICNKWSKYVGEGHWPDADMLPIGHIAIRSQEHGISDRWTRFSKNEQLTMMTLWCVFRSPLIIGCELRDNDPWTLSLLTNPEVLRVLKNSINGHQVIRNGNSGNNIVWMSQDEDGSFYIAIFNTDVKDNKIEVWLIQLGFKGVFAVRDLWDRQDVGIVSESIKACVPSHGTRLFKLCHITGK